MLTIGKIATVVSGAYNQFCVRQRANQQEHPAAVIIDNHALIARAFQNRQIGYVEGGGAAEGMIALDEGEGDRLLLTLTSVLFLAVPGRISLPFFDMSRLGYSVRRFDRQIERWDPNATRNGYEILDLRGGSIADSSVYLKPVTNSNEPDFSDPFRGFFQRGGLWYADGSSQAGATPGSSASGGRSSRIDVEYLSHLLQSEFDTIVFLLGAERHVSERATPSEKLVQLLAWAIKNRKVEDLNALVEAKRNR